MNQLLKTIHQKMINFSEIISNKNSLLKLHFPQAIKTHHIFLLNNFRKALIDLLTSTVNKPASPSIVFHK